MSKNFKDNLSKVQKSTIRDFGNQWKIHGEVREDFWSSDEMFRDYLCNLINPNVIRGKKVLEVGSGSGRILNMISRYKPKLLIGVEPSTGFSNLVANTTTIANLQLINSSGAEYQEFNVDIVFSFGVIHHIKNPEATIRNIYHSLIPGGTFVCWVYGFENNRTYVILRHIISKITRLLPDIYLDKICHQLSLLVVKYGDFSVRYFKSLLPATTYIQNVFKPCGDLEKKYIIFDQLNPRYAKYYRKKELQKLLHAVGFIEIKIAHRHQYSWTVVACKGKSDMQIES